MGEQDQPPPPKAWSSYLSDELPRTVQESADSALRSARNLQQSSSTHLRSLKDTVPQIGVRYRSYEETIFHKIKEGLVNVREHPTLAGGVAVTAALLLLRGPRRFLFRQTLGRLQSEEAQFLRAENNVKELSLSVDLMKKETTKLLERSTLAERDMMRGHSNLMNAGKEIRNLARSAYDAEAKAADLMDLLREIPGREALSLRAEVAAMASRLRQQRTTMDKRIMKISELGISV